MNAKRLKIKNLYMVLTALSVVSAVFLILVSGGKFINLYFFSDQDDSLMDFFNSLIEVHTKHPYRDFGVLYPPLANLFFYFLYLFVPENTIKHLPADHKETLYLVGSAKDLRMNQACMVVFLLTLVVSITLFIFLVQKILPANSNPLIICLIFTYPMLGALEHGNIILLALVFSLFFYIFYESSNRFLRELSLLSLAFAYGFKLYPAFLGLLLIKKKRIKDSIKTILYGILVTIIPSLFMDGLSGIPMWLKNVFGFGTDVPSSEVIQRYLAITLCLLMIIMDIVSAYTKHHIIRFTESQTLMILVWLMILINGNPEGWVLLFAIIPFTLFIKEETYIDRYNTIEFVVYMVCLLPLGINKLNYYFLPLFILGSLLRTKIKPATT